MRFPRRFTAVPSKRSDAAKQCVTWNIQALMVCKQASSGVSRGTGLCDLSPRPLLLDALVNVPLLSAVVFVTLP